MDPYPVTLCREATESACWGQTTDQGGVIFMRLRMRRMANDPQGAVEGVAVAVSIGLDVGLATGVPVGEGGWLGLGVGIGVGVALAVG